MPPGKILRAACAAALALLAASPAAAHHSYAMFDTQKTVTLDGTVREFDWTNPHIWLQLAVLDPATGKEADWSIELAAPTLMTRQGWSRTSVKQGDRLTVVVHPLKHGDNGGSMISASIDGKPIGGAPQKSRSFAIGSTREPLD